MADEPRTIDFATFLLSLGSSVLIHLGEAPDPNSGEKQPVNLPLAQQSIDLLAVLQEKTKGNLTDDEGRFLTTLLFDLRMKFVQATAKKPEEPKKA
jgi:hypothetical protein